jgi:hypothetical protein
MKTLPDYEYRKSYEPPWKKFIMWYIFIALLSLFFIYSYFQIK